MSIALAEAQFRPWLERYLDERMVPPATKADVSAEPRDDHGRWTSGGDHSAALPAGQEQMTAAEYAQAYPKRTGSNAALRKEFAARLGNDGQRALAEADRLNRAFAIGSQFDKSVGTGPNLVMASQSDFPATGGIRPVSVAAWQNGNAVYLTDDFFGVGADPLGVTYGEQFNSGFHPPGTNTPQGYLAHEYGHWVDHYIIQGGRNADGPLTPYQVLGYIDWRQKAADSPPISRYGAKNEDEQVAEVFSAAFASTSTATNDPLAVSLRDTLASIGVYKPAADVTKTDFYTEGGVVHPIRDSEGYDPAAAGESRAPSSPTRVVVSGTPLPPLPRAGRQLSGAELRSAAAAINKGLDKFRAEGGHVVVGAGPTEAAAAHDNIAEQRRAGLGEGPGYTGVEYAGLACAVREDNPVGTFVNIAYAPNGDVAGAHGYWSAKAYAEENYSHMSREDTAQGGSDVFGHGIIGSMGTIPGTGSALVAEYIRQVARDGGAAVISPVASATAFWASMGFRAIPGDAWWTSGNWSVTAADAARLAKLLH